MTSIRLFRPSALRLGVTLTLCALWMTCMHQYPSWRERGGDWVSVVIAARLVQDGHTEALYARRPDHLLVHHPLWQKQAQALDYERNLYPFLYPPVIASAFIPLARVDLAQVKPVILQAELALLVAMIGLACWHWRPTMLRPLPMALLLLSLAFSDPLLAVIRSLNIHPLVLACTIVAMIAAQRNAPILAGSALGLAAFIKVVPAVLLLYWIAQRRWACAVWCIAALLLLAVLSLGLVGIPAHLDYLGSLRDMSANIVPSWGNKSLPALLYGAAVEDLEGSAILRLVPLPGWIRMVALIAMLAGLAAVIAGAHRHRDDPPADAAGMMAVFLMATVSSPAAWTHYFTILLPSFIIWMASRPSRLAIAAMAVAQTVIVSIPITHYAKSMHAEGLPGWAVGGEFFAALLLIAALLVSRQSHRQRASMSQARVPSPSMAFPRSSS